MKSVQSAKKSELESVAKKVHYIRSTLGFCSLEETEKGVKGEYDNILSIIQQLKKKGVVSVDNHCFTYTLDKDILIVIPKLRFRAKI